MENEGKINQPLISIIVPIYNVEKYLTECVKSIQNQTYRNLEIILVDDGSTDSCGKICDNFSQIDDRIKVIHKKNAGQGRARNSGMEIATGEYYGFVDSDDAVMPQMYEILTNMILENNADIAACTRRQIAENEHIPKSEYDAERILRNVELFDGHHATKELLQSHKKFKNAVWEKLYKKELFEDIKFRSVYAEDREVMYKLLYASKIIAYTNQKLYCYRQRDGSTMLSKWNDHKDNMVYEQDEQCIAFFKERNENELVNAAIFWHLFLGVENYRRLESQDEKYRIRLKREMQEYSKWNYLKGTDYSIRRKIEFWIFGKNPSLHYEICNAVRKIKGVFR